jgi:hypothetical protein
MIQAALLLAAVLMAKAGAQKLFGKTARAKALGRPLKRFAWLAYAGVASIPSLCVFP